MFGTRYIGVWGPTFPLSWTFCEGFPERSRNVPPPLINGFPVKRCLGPESSGVPSDLSWVGQEVFGALPVMRCLGPDPLFEGLGVLPLVSGPLATGVATGALPPRS